MAMRNSSIMEMSLYILFCLLAIVGIYIAVQNRNSEALRSKVLPAFGIAVIGALLTIWFGLKGETIDFQFISTLFFNKLDKKPLDEHYQDQYKFGGDQFNINLQNFIGECLANEKELNQAVFRQNGERIKEFYHDMIFVKLISRFLWMYADRWNIRINSVRRGNSFESSVSPIDKSNPAYSKLSWEDFVDEVKDDNNFHKLLSSVSEQTSIKEMTVPPKTKMKLIALKHNKILVLSNPFVTVSIGVNRHSGSIGLGDYRWLLGYDNKTSEKFWSEHFEVHCKAEFEKFKSGHPDMPKYEQWVKTMFAEIQYQLDDEQRLKRAKEYLELIGISHTSRP